MLRMTVLIWVLAGTVLAGIAVTLVLVVPSLAANELKNIPYAAIGGYLVGVPVSWVIAKQILSMGRASKAHF
jgi:preprotein translocase subunit SecF